MPASQSLMMKATGSRPEDWYKAQLQLLKASLPDAERPRRTPLPLVPLTRLMTLQSLVAHTLGSAAAQATQAGAALPALASDPNAPQEAWTLAGAALQRWWSLQARWLEQWTALAQDMGELRKINTVSKYVDGEMNLFKQVQGLLASQTTDAAQLAENISVDVAWWLSQKTQG